MIEIPDLAELPYSPSKHTLESDEPDDYPSPGFNFVQNIDDRLDAVSLRDHQDVFRNTSGFMIHPARDVAEPSDDIQSDLPVEQVVQMKPAAFVEDVATPLPDENKFILRSKSSGHFLSPSQVDRLEPLPQLPPPLTATPLQKSRPTNPTEKFGRQDLATDSKSPAEYTLHIIFTQFVRHAERKLNMCIDFPLNEEVPIIDLLAEGVDPNFDKIVASLGYIARRKPKPVIDSVMFWRKNKSEIALMAAHEVERVLAIAGDRLTTPPPQNQPPTRGKRSLSLMRTKSLSKMAHRRNQSASLAAALARTTSFDGEFKNSFDEPIARARETAIQADRKSLASIYILCRVLIEVVKQTSPEVMGDDLGDKLEEIVYTQLKTTDPISTSESLVRLSNWNLFAELLGHMSQRRFLSVSDRFIADLEHVPAVVHHEDEPKLHLLIHGMRYLRLTNYPLEVFEESADFLCSLAKFFSGSKNELIIFAYCEVLSNLVLPLADILTAERNHPTWVEAVEKIYFKAVSLWQGLVAQPHSGSGWAYSIYLMTSMLSVSRKELFSTKWVDVVEENASKLRPKVPTEEKTTYIICIARLLWVYIYRLPDTLNNTIKKLDSLFELLFFSFNSANKKSQWLVSDVYLINVLVELVRTVGYQHLNYVLDNVLLRLLKQSFVVSMEGAQVEKLILVVKSYMVILDDYELGRKPLFPTDDVINARLTDKPDKPNDFLFIARNSTNAASHDEICRTFATILKILDTQYGTEVWQGLDSNSSTPVATSFKSQPFNFHFGIDSTYQLARNLQVELFATLLEAVPTTVVPLAEKGLSPLQFKNVVEMLTRNAVHSVYQVADAAVSALHQLALRKNPSSLITIFARVAFRFSDKPGPAYDAEYFSSSEFNQLLKIYVDLLNCWLRQFNDETKSGNPLAQDDEMMNKDVLNDLYQINHAPAEVKGRSKDEIEWKTVITLVEEIEGNGLFFLCSLDPETRHLGIAILRLVDQFDQAIYNGTDKTPIARLPTSSASHLRSSSKFAADVGTRLIHVLEEGDFIEMIKPLRKELSVPERNRVTKLKNKKNVLVRLAESDYGIDLTLWFRLYPKLLDIFFEKCPMPVAMCRSIVCVRLVQMHELVFEYLENSKRYTTSLFSRASTTACPPEVLVNQWKLYLIFACCSLTSTNEQKISFPNGPTHGRKRSLQPSHTRKRSLQLFIQHQKITSAKSVFRMVLPLLKSEQSMVRDAVVLGLSCININIFKTLLENIPDTLNDWEPLLKKRDRAEDRLRVEVIHILSNITERYTYSDVYTDDWMSANLVSLIKNVKGFLSHPPIQIDVEFQRLRRYFCGFLKNVFLGLQDKALGKWLPFEARIGCFNYLKEWCGYGDSESITADRYTVMAKRLSQSKDAAATAILEIERLSLQFAALGCMAALCLDTIVQQIPGIVAVMSFDIGLLMNWINALLSAEDERAQEVGRTALRNILHLNLDLADIYDEVIRQCYYAHDTKVTENYFTTFVGVFMDHPLPENLPYDVFCLSTFLVGSDNFEVRFLAIKVLRVLEEKYIQTATATRFTESVCTRTKVVYKKALFDISVQLAMAHPLGAFTCISYLTMFFNVVDPDTRRDILTCLLPWVQNVTLSAEDNLDSPLGMVLNNLFAITVKFSAKIANEIEALWVALASQRTNFDIIVDFIINNCLERKNPVFVEYSRQLVDYLAFSQTEPSHLIERFVANLQPRQMVPPTQDRKPVTLSVADMPYVANLAKVVPLNEKDAAFSLGQLSMVFLVDLFTVQKSESIVEQLPLLLHVAFSLLDHYLAVVQEQACAMLIHLIHTLAADQPKSQETIEVLRQRDHQKYLWVYDDLNNDKRGARTPKNMDLLARNILEIFAPLVPTLQAEWSRVSLNWATTCAVRHIACRSFQVFRSLLSFLDLNMLEGMLHRLSNTISDESLDIQGFAMQILMTLNAITAELDSEKLIDFPQLFWLSVACLSTIHEQEFIEVLSTMSKFVSKIDLDSPDTVSCLISRFPPKWEGKFEGLQHVILVGLRSATAYEPTMKFLDKLIRLKDSEVIGLGNSRLLTAVLANLPRFLHALEENAIKGDVETTASTLSEMAAHNEQHALSRILMSLAKNRFRSKKDFLVQTISTIKNGFFPEFEAQTLVLLLGLISNKTPWVKLETMAILTHVFSAVDLQREEFVGVGADLISPLLRLLLTDYAEPALEVLDEAVAISGSLLDKDVLRMSLGSIAMKKEYEKTRTLFGIPDENGWAIPMPAITAANTRHNVHAVFSTCSVPTMDEDDAKDEEIHFHMEDYYAPPQDHGDVASELVLEPASSLSNMWAALDDFDSFFTKELDPQPHHHIHSASVDTRYSLVSNDALMPMDSAPHVYDKNASYILNRSLARTQSNTSFKSNLADSIGVTSYSPGVLPKRLYVPFRNSRANFKKNELFATPVMQLSPTFDQGSAVRPQDSSSSNGTELPPHDGRFDLLSKKKTRMSMFSPTGGQASSPDLSSQYWDKKRPQKRRAQPPYQ